MQGAGISCALLVACFRYHDCGDVFTHRISDGDAANGIRAGANDYITKPVSATELALRIQALAKITRQLIWKTIKRFTAYLIWGVHQLRARVYWITVGREWEPNYS